MKNTNQTKLTYSGKETIEEKFLRLAIIEQVKYQEIAEQHGISHTECSRLWKDLEKEREELSLVLKIWKAKSENKKMGFHEFKQWYETPKHCHYCGITQAELDLLWPKNALMTKRKRGRKFEIDREEAGGDYSIENMVCACYWCNNAKTDTFTEEEFKQIGQAIKAVWQKRLAE